LGERELCKLEVIGSIPFSSTNYLTFQNGFEVEAGCRKPETPEAGSEGTCFVFFLFCLLMKQKLTL